MQSWSCDLTASEIEENEKYNAQFQVTTSEKELVEKYLVSSNPENSECFLSTTEILIHLSEKSENRIKLNTNSLGRALKMLGFEREMRGQDRKKGYYIRYKIQ
jgi:hypothetical protein